MGKVKNRLVYQVVTAHHSDITFKGRPTSKISSPVSIDPICISDQHNMLGCHNNTLDPDEHKNSERKNARKNID